MEKRKYNQLESDRLEEIVFCEHCILGNTHRLKFETGKHTPNQSIDYAHAYL